MNEAQCRKIVKRRATETVGFMACERCGRMDMALSLHHRRKRSHLPKVRMWEPSNCVMLCGDGVQGCHGWTEANPLLARQTGWHVRSTEEARDVPVKLWYTQVPVFLNEYGGWSACGWELPEDPFNPDDWFRVDNA